MWDELLFAVLAITSPPSLADLPRGEPPGIGYVDHGAWHGPDGARVDLPDRHGISAITPYDGGFLIADTRYFEGSVGLVRVDEAGQKVGDWTSSGAPAVAADGQVAWSTFIMPESGETGPSLVHVGTRQGCMSTRSREGTIPFGVAGFVGDNVVVTTPIEVSLVDPAGGTRVLPRLTYAFDATDDRVAGTLGRGRGVLDVGMGEVLWRARSYDLMFSPSGRRIALTDREGVVVRRSADGQVLWRAELPFHAEQMAWEDERNLLVVANRGDRSAILRIDRGGDVERTTAVTRHDAFRPPYVLPSQ